MIQIFSVKQQRTVLNSSIWQSFNIEFDSYTFRLNNNQHHPFRPLMMTLSTIVLKLMTSMKMPPTHQKIRQITQRQIKRVLILHRKYKLLTSKPVIEAVICQQLQRMIHPQTLLK